MPVTKRARGLLLYCQHSLGMGHLVRSFALARALAHDFDVVFLNGGRIPEGIRPPEGITVVDLPALGMRSDGELVSHDERYTVEQATAIRRRTILEVFSKQAPRVLLIELFPFGRRKFAGEIMPLLEIARSLTRDEPLVLCSLRDILVRGRARQQEHDDRACALINDYFHGVLVHTDPDFARLEETFRPAAPLRVPVHYTGFVLPGQAGGRRQARERRILVSAGGGIVGGPLFAAALAAHRELWLAERLPMTIVAGPFLPQSEFRELQRAAVSLPGLDLYRSVPDLTTLMRRTAASVSQCGYNTAMDLLHTGVAALVVPFATASEDEQLNRARRLQALGLVRVLAPERLSEVTLVGEIRALLGFDPPPVKLNMNGARITARLIRQWTIDRRSLQRFTGWTSGAAGNGP